MPGLPASKGTWASCWSTCEAPAHHKVLLQKT